MPAAEGLSAFESFYDRHWKTVYRICMMFLQSEADAEDCTEDVFVKVLTGGMVFEDEVPYEERRSLRFVL